LSFLFLWRVGWGTPTKQRPKATLFSKQPTSSRRWMMRWASATARGTEVFHLGGDALWHLNLISSDGDRRCADQRHLEVVGFDHVF
jgi:hypothetical protein